MLHAPMNGRGRAPLGPGGAGGVRPRLGISLDGRSWWGRGLSGPLLDGFQGSFRGSRGSGKSHLEVHGAASDFQKVRKCPGSGPDGSDRVGL